MFKALCQLNDIKALSSWDIRCSRLFADLMNVEIFKIRNLNLLDIKYLTSATAEKSDSQG